jgi:hypothetical protein
MKTLISILAVAGMPAMALNISQDQGRLTLQYAEINRPYEVQVQVPDGCPRDLVSVKKTPTQIVVQQHGSCPTGALVSIKVSPGQSVNAELGAGSLEFLGFNSVRDSIGRMSVESEIGTTTVPTLSGFAKTFDNYVGRGYEREGQAQGAVVELKVRTGIVKVAR